MKPSLKCIWVIVCKRAQECQSFNLLLPTFENNNAQRVIILLCGPHWKRCLRMMDWLFLTSLQSSADWSFAPAPARVWKTDTALQDLRDFSCAPNCQGTAHLNGPLNTTQHTDSVSCYISIRLKTSALCVCVCVGALTAGCQNKVLKHITQSKHLIHPFSDGPRGLIN